jgi:hypothetical protein
LLLPAEPRIDLNYRTWNLGLGRLWVAPVAFAAQDRFTLKSPNGIAFSEFRGYDTWQDVAVSQTENGIKAILGNPVIVFTS